MSLEPGTRSQAHAHLQLLRGERLQAESPAADGGPEPWILESWRRCEAMGLDFHLKPAIPHLPQAQLDRLRERHERVRRLARAELETLAGQIAGSNYLLVFADPQGVILDSIADNRFELSGSATDIVPGACWSEATAGTNGLGTAIALGRAVAVTGAEHYHWPLAEVSCTAAPIRDAFGQLVGVLDASSYVQTRQRHTLALVEMAAAHIENDLLLHQMREHWVLAIHPRAEFLGTLGAGLLAFDDEGRLRASNARGRQMLSGLAAVPGSRYEELFAEAWPALLSRLQHGSELPLRDALGSAIAARCVMRPPRRVAARPALADAVAPPLPRRAAPVPAAVSVPLRQEAPLPFVADDEQVRRCGERVARAVALGVPLLLQGETGTGKELLARHAHESSGRRGPFVAINCAALPAELFEAELFGHAPGAYTGARREGSAGLLASADQGTLLLDEVGDLPLPMQAALLRFLDDRQVRPIGALQSRRVDVQLLAATHVDLEQAVAERRFRADLYHRLNTVRVVLPPLRERQDLERMAGTLLAALSPSTVLDPAAMAWLRAQAWPGNVRQLRAVLTQAVLAMPPGSTRIDAVLLQSLIGDGASATPARAGQTGGDSPLRREITRRIATELQRCGGNVSEVARRLGVSRTTIYRHQARMPRGQGRRAVVE